MNSQNYFPNDSDLCMELPLSHGNKLPCEIWFYIFSKMDWETKCVMRSTSRLFRQEWCRYLPKQKIMSVRKYILKLFDKDKKYRESPLGQIINVSVPLQYEPVNIHPVRGLSVCSVKDQKKYFKKITSTNFYIESMNGGSLSSRDKYECDMCRGEIENIGGYFYCMNCFMDICKKCRKSHKCIDLLLISRNSGYDGSYYCDLCYEEGGSPFTIEDYKRYSNQQLNKDLCVDCADVNPDFVAKYKLEFIDNNIPAVDQWRFGSMLDWVPIYSNRDLILMNLNPASPMFKRLSFGIYRGSGSSIRYFTIPKRITLETILSWIETKYDEGIAEGDDPSEFSLINDYFVDQLFHKTPGKK